MAAITIVRELRKAALFAKLLKVQIPEPSRITVPPEVHRRYDKLIAQVPPIQADQVQHRQEVLQPTALRHRRAIQAQAIALRHEATVHLHQAEVVRAAAPEAVLAAAVPEVVQVTEDKPN